MAYVCELGTGQSVYLENQGAQTVVTLISSGPGQQQQASSSFTTGVWTSPPQVFRTPHGLVLKVISELGERSLQIQGTSVSVLGEMPSVMDSQQLTVQEVTSTPVSPLKPMETDENGTHETHEPKNGGYADEHEPDVYANGEYGTTNGVGCTGGES
ncbi:MAG: hypothetical protein RSE13_04510 [Planktothrix sp. GU0601_MAG3]|nr:MAG: hypothetical protein RSE13_04510 [Planktothrix sp. GU0601_MAG3]